MITQAEIKLIRSLSTKKFRQKYNLFVAEGKKLTKEFVKSKYSIKKIFTTKSFIDKNIQNNEVIDENIFNKITFLKNHQHILCLIEIPTESTPLYNVNTIILDNIQDPGNLGTIIRLADWFGISQIICSPNTVDCYNPKVVQATMGSLTRVQIIYTDIFPFIEKFNGICYATTMNGENIYTKKIENTFAIIMGNEGNGISDDILKKTNEIISIPHFSKNAEVESLNVAIATSIILSEFLGKKII